MRSQEVKCLFVLGCEDCSEAVAVYSADRVAGILNAARDKAKAQDPSKSESVCKFFEIPGAPIGSVRWYMLGLSGIVFGSIASIALFYAVGRIWLWLI